MGDKRKRYRYELTNHPLWHKIAPMLRAADPQTVYEWLTGGNTDAGGKYHRVEKQVSVSQQAYTSLSTRVKTLDDLIQEAEIDLNKWEVSSYTQNFWECGSRNPSGMILPCTLYQVKAILKPINPGFEILRNGILEEIRQETRPVQKINYPPTVKSLCVEMCIFDFHIGKLSFNEAGENVWPLEECERIYDDVINKTLSKIDISQIDRFLLPTGNDALNIDSPAATTTRGTPQLTGNYWEHLMTFTFKLLYRNINKLSAIAPVYVPIVPGNHAENSMFSIGCMLAAAFKENENVFIDNGIAKRKYHNYGQNLIGYTHGHNAKAKDLHALMSTDEPLLYGTTKYRAYHIGHFHSNKKTRIVFKDFKDQYQGVTMEICPSLSPTDRWHYEKGYVGALRQAKTFVWEKDSGVVQELYYTID